jgi:hypothetical protein
MSEQETILVLKPLYMIKAYSKTVRFTWSSNPRKPLKGSTDLKTRVGFPELLKLAGKMGCQINGSEILPPNQDAYNRLLVYACVRTALKRPSEVLRLADWVVEMSGWDALYWASAFRKLWWSSPNHRSLRRAVRAFKLFFNID